MDIACGIMHVASLFDLRQRSRRACGQATPAGSLANCLACAAPTHTPCRQAKLIAGRIIPAIATTTAMATGGPSVAVCFRLVNGTHPGRSTPSCLLLRCARFASPVCRRYTGS